MRTSLATKLAIAAVGAATHVVMFAGAATAQVTGPGGRIVTFGDSLSDNGNTKALTGNPPAPYYGGRFSNGPTWVETLAGGSMNSPFQGTGLNGNVNLAFGGARADNGTNLNGPLPSVGTQVGYFLTHGGTFGKNDLVTMQGGANDIFQYFTTAGAGATPGGIIAASTNAANALSADVALAISGGAKRLLVANLPDIGATPAYNGSPATAGAGSLASQTYNAAWQQGIVALAGANRGVNIVQMDVNALVKLALANPNAFGYTNVTQACTSVAACVTGSTATQNQYFFWDSVHPTESGQLLEARYAALLLNANVVGQVVTPARDVAINGRKQSTEDTFDRVSQWAYGSIARQNGFYTTVTGSFANARQNDATPAYRSNVGGARFGLDKAYGNTLIGGGTAFSLGDLSVNGGYKADLAMAHADAYIAQLFGKFYVTASAGGSYTSIDGKRDTGIPTAIAAARTSGLAGNAAAEAGYIAQMGGITLVPSARLSYIRSNINGFSESAPLLAMAYSNMNFDGVVASAKLRAITPVAFGLRDGRAFGEIGYEKYLTANNGAVIGSLVNNTALPFEIATTNPVANGWNMKLGAEGKITDTATLTVSYGLALQGGTGQVHTGQARVKVPF